MPRPDEGLIHAWLDGQLPPEEAARVEQLAATDTEWAAAVAEARGLVAASSRILSALDRVPSGVIPLTTAVRPTHRLPWWTKAAAAIAVMAGGSMLVIQRTTAPNVATSLIKTSAPEVKAAVPVKTLAPPGGTQKEKKTTVLATDLKPQSTVGPVQRREERSIATAAPSVANVPANTPVLKDATIDRAVPRAATQPLLAKSGVPKAADSAALSVADITPTAGAAPALRAAGGTAVPVRVAAPAPAAEQQIAARRVSGVSGNVMPAKATLRDLRCYRVREPSAPAEAGVVMRAVRVDGDTLRLEPAAATSTLRAWIIWRDGVGHGAIMTSADGKDAVAVEATLTACPTP